MGPLELIKMKCTRVLTDILFNPIGVVTENALKLYFGQHTCPI